MADKSFGVKEIELIGASGTPTIESPNNLDIKAVNVAISTDITVGGMVSLGAGTSISSPGTNVLTFGTNNAERVRIHSTGVPQFTTTGTQYPAATVPAFVVNSNGDHALVLNNQNTTDPRGLFIYQNQDVNNGTSYFWRARAGGTDRAHLYSNGTLQLHSGNLKLASGNGIDFSATGDASGMTSELLDDYEEGTWTPTIRLEGGTANGTTLAPESTSYKGRYVKIGDMVFVEAYVRYNLSGLSGTWTSTRIQGLPYTQGNQNSQQYTPVHIGYLSNFYSGFPTTNNNFPGGYIRTGQSDLVLTINNPNGAETTISNSVLSSSASGGIMFSAYYRDSASG